MLAQVTRRLREATGKGVDYSASHWPVSTLFGISSLLSILLPIILVRYLVPAEIGMFKIFFLYLMLVPEIFLASGFASGLAYWIGQGRKGEEALALSLRCIFLLGILVSLVFMVLSGFLAEYFDVSRFLVILFSLAAFSMITAHLFEEVCIFRGHTWLGAIFHASFAFVRTALMVLAAIVFESLEAVLLAHVLVNSAKALIGAGLLINIERSIVKWNFALLRPVFNYSLPVGLSGALIVIAVKADQLLLSNSLDSASFALYAIGCFALPPLFILEQSLTRLLVPRLSDCFSSGQKARAIQLYRSTVQELAFWTVPAVAGLIIFAEPLIVLLFTEQYRDAAMYLQIFALSYLCMIFPFDVTARGRADSGWILQTGFMSAALALALCSVLLTFFGAMGALFGLILSRSLVAAWGLRYHTTEMGCSLSALVPFEQISRFFMATAVLSVLALGIRHWFPSELSWFLVAGSLFFLLYIAARPFFKLEMSPGNQERPAILILTETLNTGGLERVVVDLAKGVEHDGKLRVVVVAYNQGKQRSPLLDELEKSGVEVISLSKGAGVSLAMPWQLAILATKHRALIIHTHDLGALLYGSLAKLFIPWRASLVHTQHTFSHVSVNKRYGVYERFFSLFCDHAVAVSSGVMREYEQLGIKPKSYSVIPNGTSLTRPIAASDWMTLQARLELATSLDDHRLRELALQSLGETWVVSLGRLCTVKGQDQLLLGWDALDHQLRSEIRLFIIGPESEPGFALSLEELRSRLPREEKIHIIPEHHDGGMWIAAADIFCSLSRAEGHPLASLEAAQLGKRLLLSDIEAHRTFFNQATFVSTIHPQSFWKALSALLSAPDQWEKRAAYAERLRWSFSTDRMVRAYTEIYEFQFDELPGNKQFASQEVCYV